MSIVVFFFFFFFFRERNFYESCILSYLIRHKILPNEITREMKEKLKISKKKCNIHSRRFIKPHCKIIGDHKHALCSYIQTKDKISYIDQEMRGTNHYLERQHSVLLVMYRIIYLKAKFTSGGVETHPLVSRVSDLLIKNNYVLKSNMNTN